MMGLPSYVFNWCAKLSSLVETFGEGLAVCNVSFGRRYKQYASLAMIATLGLPIASFAQTVDPLLGVTKITVVMEDLSDDAYDVGLTDDRLKTITELKLRVAGIRVLSDEEDKADTQINPYIYIQVTFMPVANVGGNVMGYTFFCHIELRRLVVSPINGAIINATLWEKGSLFVASKTGASGYVEDSVNKAMDSFLNDYLKANPLKR